MSDRGANGKPTSGVSSPVVAISIVGILALIVEFAVLNSWAHTSEENAAYRYTEMKSSRDTTRVYCDLHATGISSLKIWAEQNNIKPPPEYLVVKDCTVKTPDEIKRQEGH